MPKRANRQMVQGLVERGGRLAEIVNQAIPELAKVVPPERLSEILGALMDWDCEMAGLDEALLEDGKRSPRKRQDRLRNAG